jgi:hypothetical protein
LSATAGSVAAPPPAPHPCQLQFGVLEASVTQHALARLQRQRLRKHRSGVHAGMELAALAAGIDGRGQLGQ